MREWWLLHWCKCLCTCIYVSIVHMHACIHIFISAKLTHGSSLVSEGPSIFRAGPRSFCFSSVRALGNGVARSSRLRAGEPNRVKLLIKRPTRFSPEDSLLAVRATGLATLLRTSDGVHTGYLAVAVSSAETVRVETRETRNDRATMCSENKMSTYEALRRVRKLQEELAV